MYLVSLITLILFLTNLAWAAPALLSYQGRILRADGTALKHNNMSFRFQITNPSGSCIIYEEQIDGYDMSTSNGLFDVAVGSGTRNYPTSGSMTIIGSLNDLGSYTCKDGSSYTSTLSEGRKLRVQFYDGVAWSTITPYMDIRTVPYAGYAKSAAQLGGVDASAYLLKSQIPTCSASSTLSWSGTAFSCAALPAGGGGGGSGTVTEVVAANSYLSVADGTTVAKITVNTGTAAGTLAVGNDTRIVNAMQTGASAGGDLSGTYPNPGVARIQNIAVNSAAPTSGQFMKYNGTHWTGSSIATTDVSGLSAAISSGVTAGISGVVLQSQFSGSCAADQTLTFVSPSSSFTCTDIAIAGSQVTGNITGTAAGFSGALIGDVSGTQGATSVDKLKGNAITTTSLTAGDYLKFSGGAWVNSKITLADLPSTVAGGLWTESGGNVHRATGMVGVGTSYPQAAFHVAGPSDGDLIIESGSATGGNAGFSLVSKSSGGVANYTNIIADWAGNLVFRGATGSYTFRSSTNTSLLHIAPNGNVGIGTVAAPAAKLDVNGSIRAQEICDETGANCKDISTGWASGGGGTGTVTEVTATGPLSVTNGTSTPALTIAQATTSTNGYVSSADWNTFNNKLGTAAAFVGDVTGTYNATTIANNAVTTGKILDGTITGADLNFAGVNTATTGFVMRDSTGSFYNFACSTTGHVPTWTASGFACQAPSVVETDPKIGVITQNYLPKWNGTALVTSGVIESGGNVGIGTASPTAKLSVAGSIDATTTFEVVGPYGSLAGTAISDTNAPSLTFARYRVGFPNLSPGDTLGEIAFRSTSMASGALIRSDATETHVQSSATGGNLTFHTNPNGSYGRVQRMVIADSGNVGIGTPTPAAKLEVAGNVHVSGQIKSGFLAHSSSTVNWNSGNTQTTTAVASTLTFTAGTMLDGGNYTLVLKSAGTFTLGTAGDITVWKCNPACASNQIVATGETVLTIIKAGNTGYVSWITDF